MASVSCRSISSTAQIVAAHMVKSFENLSDFCHRVGLPRCLTENLILSGAMDHFGSTRREQVWALANLLDEPGMLDLDMPEDPLIFPKATRGDVMAVEYDLMGVMLGEHLLVLYRDRLDKLGVLSRADLIDCAPGSLVRVAGLAVVYQAPPTAKGHHFIQCCPKYGVAAAHYLRDSCRSFWLPNTHH